MLEERTTGGVSFGLTDEQKALRDVAHDFAEREIRPREREYDEHSTHPAEVLAKAHELGHAGDRIHVEPVLDVVLDRVREDAVVDEAPDGVLQEPLFVAELEVHLGPSLSPPAVID